MDNLNKSDGATKNNADVSVRMKVFLQSQFFKILGGQSVGGGLVSTLENQRKMLGFLNIPFTEIDTGDWDIVQINIPWPKSVRLAKRAKKEGKKVIMWSHVTIEDLEKSIALLKIGFLRNYVKKYLKNAFSVADMVLCPSQYTKNLLIAYGLPEEKLTVQSNAVDIKKFYFDQNLRDEYRKKYKLTGMVVGNVGLVIYRKGIDTFLEVAKEFKNYTFIWFGKMFNKALAQGVKTETPTNVSFTGYVDNIVASFNALDIFFFPSYEENQGMVILEAAAVGLPILVREIPTYEGWLVHEVNCLKAKNKSEFETYLKMLLEDENLRNRLKTGALELAKNESIETQAQHLKKVYDKLLN